MEAPPLIGRDEIEKLGKYIGKDITILTCNRSRSLALDGAVGYENGDKCFLSHIIGHSPYAVFQSALHGLPPFDVSIAARNPNYYWLYILCGKAELSYDGLFAYTVYDDINGDFSFLDNKRFRQRLEDLNYFDLEYIDVRPYWHSDTSATSGQLYRDQFYRRLRELGIDIPPAGTWGDTVTGFIESNYAKPRRGDANQLLDEEFYKKYGAQILLR